MLLVIAIATPVSAQPVALRGPAPVAPGIDAPTRRLPAPRRSRPPHETPTRPAAVDSERRRPAPSLADVRPTAGPPLSLLSNFEGAEYDGHSLDYEVAAGPEHLMLATNDGLALRERNGTVVASLRSMSAFFDSVRQPQEFVGDPRLIYDVATERFFVAAIGVQPNPVCAPGRCVAHSFVAVSKRSAPASLDVSDWYFYALDSTLDGTTPTARWADFVQLGLNDTVVVLTARMHPFVGSPSGSKIRILDKAPLVRGQPVSWTDFVDVKDPSSGVTGFAPALHFDRTDRFFLVRGCWGTDPSAVTVLEIKDALLRTPGLLKAGTASLFVEEDRVGDYFGAALDVVDGSAWLVGQFASAPTETTSWVGKVELPGLAGRRLLPGQSITSPSGRIRLLYQADGDLVLSDHERRETLWSSSTSGTAPGCAILQLDGDLVVYDANGSALWSSGTGGNRNASLVVEDDGNLVIVSWDGRTIWDPFRDRHGRR